MSLPRPGSSEPPHALLAQGGALDAFCDLVEASGARQGVLLGPDELPPFQVGAATVRQVRDPWAFERRARRLDRAHARAALLVAWLKRASGLDLGAAGLAEGLQHELMYFLCEGWIHALRQAELAASLPCLASGPLAIAPRGGLSAAIFQARLASLRSDGGGRRPGAGRAAAAAPGGRLGGLMSPGRSVRGEPYGPTGGGVLVVEAYANRLRNMAPVIERLGARLGPVRVLGVGMRRPEREALAAVAAELELPLVPWERVAAAAVGGPTLARALRLSVGAFRLAGRLDGLLGRDGVRGAGRLRLAGRLLTVVQRCVLRSTLLGSLFDVALRPPGPRCVLTSRGDDTLLRFLGRAGLRHGVPVLDVEHGKRIDAAQATIRDLPGVDFALSGGGSQAIYRGAGIAQERLWAVGSPAFDRLVAEARDAPDPGLPRPYFLYCSNAIRIHKRWVPDNPHARLLAELDRCLRRFPHHHLVVKLHPQEHDGATQALVDGMERRDRVRVIRGGANGALLSRADVQLSLGSTTTVEALLLGTPGVFVDPFGIESDFAAAVEAGAVARVTDLAQLGDVLETLRSKRVELGSLEQHYAHALDGRSAERIADLALRLAAR